MQFITLTCDSLMCASMYFALLIMTYLLLFTADTHNQWQVKAKVIGNARYVEVHIRLFLSKFFKTHAVLCNPAVVVHFPSLECVRSGITKTN